MHPDPRRRSPFAEITAFEPTADSSLQGELLPLRYAHYRAPTHCTNCGWNAIDSKTFLVLAHPRRVDVAKMTAITEFELNLPRTVHNLPTRDIPACTMCFEGDRAPDLSHLPAPIEAPAWTEAVERARLRSEKDAAKAAKQQHDRSAPRKTPSINDI